MPENKKIQIVINKDIWRSAEELGDEIKRQDPDKYGHRNSHELGTKAVKSKPNLRIVPLEWGDMHPLTASGNVARDWWRSAKEDVEGGYEFAKAPIETSQAMGGATSLLHEEVTAPKIRSLLESISGISLKGLPQTAGPGHEPLGSRVNPEDKEAMRAAGTEFLEETFTPAGIQGRPARAFSNWRALLDPAARMAGGTRAARKIRNLTRREDPRKIRDLTGRADPGTGEKIVRGLGNLMDPSTAPFVALKAPLKFASWAKGKLKDSTGVAAKKIAGMISDRKLTSESAPLWLEVLTSTYGFTTSTGQQFMQAMYDYGQKKIRNRSGDMVSAEDMIRDVRHMNQDRSADLLLVRALEMINDYKRQMDEDFAQAKSQLPVKEGIEIAGRKSPRGPRGERFDDPQPGGINVEPGPIDTNSLKKRALETLRKNFGVRQTGTFGRETTISSQGDPITTEFSTGEGRLIFDKFGEAPRGKTTTISSVGSGQAMVRELYESLINANPDGSPVTVEELWNFRRTLDDAIGVAVAEHTTEARKALSDLRGLVSEELAKVPGFSETMAEWEQASLLLERAESELGLQAGKLTQGGEVRDINRKETLESLISALGDDKAAPLGRQTLEALQAATGNETIIPTILGYGANNLAANSLATHSKFADLGRGVMAMGLAFGGLKALYVVPALAIFSPRFVSEAALELAARVKGEKATFARTQAFMKRAEEVHRKAVELNESTGGELAKIAAREQWTLGQMFERLQVETEMEIEGSGLRKSPSTLETLSKMKASGMGPQHYH